MVTMAQTQGITEFLGVVEHGGFTAAADVLGTSKSHISRQVTRLETRLGTRLLNRTTRRVVLTDMGRVYYERCRGAMDQLDGAAAELADLQARPKGLVRITAPGIYAEQFLTPALIEFSLRYPEVTFQLDTQMATVDLIQSGYDLAVRNEQSRRLDAHRTARRASTNPRLWRAGLLRRTRQTRFSRSACRPQLPAPERHGLAVRLARPGSRGARARQLDKRQRTLPGGRGM